MVLRSQDTCISEFYQFGAFKEVRDAIVRKIKHGIVPFGGSTPSSREKRVWLNFSR